MPWLQVEQKKASTAAAFSVCLRSPMFAAVAKSMARIRLIDKIAVCGLNPPRFYRRAAMKPDRRTAAIARKLADAERFVMDGVAQYYLEAGRADYRCLSEFPDLTPAAPLMWIEFRFPRGEARGEFGRARGAAVLVESRETAACAAGIPRPRMERAGARWWQTMTAFVDPGTGARIRWELPVASWFVTAEGRFWMPARHPLLCLPGLSARVLAEKDETGKLLALPAAFRVAALALSFLNGRQPLLRKVTPAAREAPPEIRTLVAC